jgi:hypothetical protein
LYTDIFTGGNTNTLLPTCEREMYRSPEYIVDVISDENWFETMKYNMKYIKKCVGKENIARRNIFQAEIWTFGIICV